MDRAQMKEQAKSLIKGRLLTCFLPLLIYTVISGAFAGVNVDQVNWKSVGDSAVNAGFGVNIISLIMPAFSYIAIVWFLKLIRTDSTTMDNFFAPIGSLDKFFRPILVSLIKGVLIALWSLLLIVPGVIRALQYSQTKYLIYDVSGDYMDYLRLSKKITKGHLMELLKLYVSFLGWYLLVAVTFGIAYIYVGPYSELSYCLMYEKLRGEYEAAHPGTFPAALTQTEQETDGQEQDEFFGNDGESTDSDGEEATENDYDGTISDKDEFSEAYDRLKELNDNK